MDTTLTTYVAGEKVYEGPSLETAIRAWDRATYASARSISGGISIQVRDSQGTIMRDGWLLHVNESGTCYVNPGIGLVNP
jgi:hypothetical protein